MISACRNQTIEAHIFKPAELLHLRTGGRTVFWKAVRGLSEIRVDGVVGSSSLVSVFLATLWGVVEHRGFSRFLFDYGLESVTELGGEFHMETSLQDFVIIQSHLVLPADIHLEVPTVLHLQLDLVEGRSAVSPEVTATVNL